MVDQDAALAGAAAGELRAAWSESFENALADQDLEAVVIATPTPLHARMVEEAAAAGKHVFCEKPLSLDPDSGRSATRAAEAAGVALQVGFQRRFDPDLQAARTIVGAGELGDIQLVRITHRNRVPPHTRELEERLGSAFVDMTIHDFDTARWLAGEIDEVSAFTGARTQVVIARFANGALGVIDNTRAAAYGYDCAVELMGERSTLRVGSSFATPNVERLTPAGRTVPLPADHIQRHRAAYLEELRHFVACIRSGTRPAVGGADSVAALELSLAAERCVA